MKKLAAYIVLIFAFSTFFIGCNSAKKCGCPTFGQKELPKNMTACSIFDTQKLN